MAFSQRDRRWAKEALGGCDLTIGRAGCLVCSAASMLAGFGTPIDPRRLNLWLTDHQGYVRGCHFVFDSLRGLGANLSALIRCPHEPAPMEVIAAALAANCGVLAMIDAVPAGRIEQHWVQILAVDGDDCGIMDPWRLPGQEEVSLIEHYGLPGWDAAQAILQVAIYTANHERVIAFTYPDPRSMEAQGRMAQAAV